MTVEQTAAAVGISEAELRALDEAFAFDGERCNRIVAKVLERIASGT